MDSSGCMSMFIHLHVCVTTMVKEKKVMDEGEQHRRSRMQRGQII